MTDKSVDNSFLEPSPRAWSLCDYHTGRLKFQTPAQRSLWSRFSSWRKVRALPWIANGKICKEGNLLNGWEKKGWRHPVWSQWGATVKQLPQVYNSSPSSSGLPSIAKRCALFGAATGREKRTGELGEGVGTWDWEEAGRVGCGVDGAMC